MTAEQIKLSKQIRLTGDIEGVSYLVLLGIAMPLKYYAGMPEAVRVVGMLHGILFIAFFYMVFRGWTNLRMGFGWVLYAVFLSVVPFGTFLLHYQLKNRETVG
jgi:integral membrane protein